MKTKNVAVVPYNEQWPMEFEKIKYQISAALGAMAISIEHVGSTSVVGLWAKPIIDIDVVIGDRTSLPKVVECLGEIGYQHEGNLGIEGREAFCYEGKPDLMCHHLYVCQENSPELKRHITFRNHLRENPKAVEEYGRIKREGAALFPDDIDKYIDYKSAVIKKIYHECGL